MKLGIPQFNLLENTYLFSWLYVFFILYLLVVIVDPNLSLSDLSADLSLSDLSKDTIHNSPLVGIIAVLAYPLGILISLFTRRLYYEHVENYPVLGCLTLLGLRQLTKWILECSKQNSDGQQNFNPPKQSNNIAFLWKDNCTEMNKTGLLNDEIYKYIQSVLSSYPILVSIEEARYILNNCEKMYEANFLNKQTYEQIKSVLSVSDSSSIHHNISIPSKMARYILKNFQKMYKFGWFTEEIHQQMQLALNTSDDSNIHQNSLSIAPEVARDIFNNLCETIALSSQGAVIVERFRNRVRFCSVIAINSLLFSIVLAPFAILHQIEGSRLIQMIWGLQIIVFVFSHFLAVRNANNFWSYIAWACKLHFHKNEENNKNESK